jgi:ParB-like chromosome segregation protein Spo0J
MSVLNFEHKIESRAISALTPYPSNARKHTKRQVKQIARSIESFGFTNPVLVGDNGQILAGHGRVEAAKLLGIEQVPTIKLAHLSAAERKAYGMVKCETDKFALILNRHIKQ